MIVHEAGHQFWYGIVANDEFEDAWLDEGLVTYSTYRILETAYGDRVLVQRYLRGLVPVRFPGIEVSRWNRTLNSYRRFGSFDTPERPTFRYYPPTARSISYDKTALWLATLESYVGTETLREILSVFFHRYRFRHPTPEDFFGVACEVAEEDLSWFFDQVHRGSATFDYGIASVASFDASPVGWMERDGDLVYVEPGEDAADAEKLYRTEVVVRRWGGGRFPVDVLLVFEDGHEVSESWNGLDRWKQYVVERPARLEYAEVDPDRALTLDTDRTNNSRRLKPGSRLPAAKWASKWMIRLQDLLSTYAFFM